MEGERISTIRLAVLT